MMKMKENNEKRDKLSLIKEINKRIIEKYLSEVMNVLIHDEIS